mgnify:CR=1 FL=1
MVVDRVAGSSRADIYLDPGHPRRSNDIDAQGYYYDVCKITFNDGNPPEQTYYGTSILNPGFVLTKATDYNLRVSGKELSVQAAQSDVDFTSPSWNVGPDKYQDLKLTVANVSTYGPSFVMLRGPAGRTFPDTQVPEQWFWGSPPELWYAGNGTRSDRNDHWRMEFQQDRTGVDSGNPIYTTTANAYVSPGSNLQNQALTFTVVYPNGKQDVFPHTGQTLVAPFTNPTAPYSRVPAPYSITSFPGTVSWDKQLPSSGANNDPGDIHLNVDGLPDATTLTNVMLSNEFGQEWPFNQDGVNVPLRTAYSAHSTRADIDFPPVRDETNSRLMLRFTLGS